MIGLQYLFRVVYQLLNKMYKESQKEIIIENATTLMSSSSDYELLFQSSGSGENIAYDAEIEQNALMLQIACESFFSSLIKTMSYCPLQFKELCHTLEVEVHSKYPDHPTELCIASFIFLRFFVAGITIPGILWHY